MNQRLLLVVIGVALALGFASCGDAVPQPTPSPTASPEGELPPAWVQKEVAWQSLAAGDAHPQGCSWTVTRAPCLAFLAPFLRSYADRSTNAVYFVVLRGHFHAVETPGKSGDRMYLVLQKRGYYYLAHGLLPGQIAVKQLPRMRSYRPVVPVSASIWGSYPWGGWPGPRRALPGAEHAGHRMRRQGSLRLTARQRPLRHGRLLLPQSRAGHLHTHHDGEAVHGHDRDREGRGAASSCRRSAADDVKVGLVPTEICGKALPQEARRRLNLYRQRGTTAASSLAGCGRRPV